MEQDLERLTWSKQTQTIVLVALLALLAVSMTISFSSNRRVRTAAGSPENNLARIGDQDEVPKLALLHQTPAEPEEIERNIFEFEQERTPQNPVAVPQTAAPPELPQFPDVRYLGLYEEKGASKVRLAAVSNGGKIYVGGVGQILGGKYQVVEIDDEFLVLRVLADGRMVQLPLARTGSPV